MRFIFIVLFLVSFGSASMGGVGDVYFCEMKNFIELEDHVARKYTLQKFKFKWEQSQIKFGKDGYFDEASIKIIWENEKRNMFEAHRVASHLMFQEGNFYWSQGSWDSVTSISAKCDKF